MCFSAQKGVSMIKYILTAIKTMWKYARFATVLKFVEVIIISTMTPLSLLFTQKLINGFIAYFNSKGSISFLILWTTLLIFSMFLASGTGFISDIQSINMKRKLDKEFTQHIIDKYRKIEFFCFEDTEMQDTLSRMGNSPQDLILNTFQDTMAGFSALISATGIILIFAQVSWWLPLMFFALIPIMTWLDFKAMSLMNEMFNNQTEDERWLSYFEGLLSQKDSLLELKIFSAVNYIMNLWKKKSKKVLSDRLKTTIRAQKYFAVSSIIILIWVGMLVYFAIKGINVKVISLGLFISLIGSVGSLLGITERLSYTFSNIARHYLQVEHYEIFLNLPEVPKNEFNQEYKITDPEIEFLDVCFTYPGTEKEILKGVSFKIRYGERLAIVGENGAGKSTIIKLLCRLYQPNRGEIRINNKNINDLSQKQLHDLLCVVFQDFCRYNLSLRENVALSQIDRIGDDLEIRQALEKANAENISDNLDVPLGKIEDDGIDMSGGQWQRIAFSRALFSDSMFVILDEPTSSLDPLAESEMYQSFARILNDRGCIMISHRLASAKMADRIIVINDGIVIENGNHDELLENNGLYAQMWKIQSSWYVEVSSK